MQNQLAETQEDREALREVEDLKNTAEEEATVRGTLITKTEELYQDLQDYYFQINHQLKQTTLKVLETQIHLQ